MDYGGYYPSHEQCDWLASSSAVQLHTSLLKVGETTAEQKNNILIAVIPPKSQFSACQDILSMFTTEQG